MEYGHRSAHGEPGVRGGWPGRCGWCGGGSVFGFSVLGPRVEDGYQVFRDFGQPPHSGANPPAVSLLHSWGSRVFVSGGGGVDRALRPDPTLPQKGLN